MIEIAFIIFMLLLLGAAMFWGARYSKIKCDEFKKNNVTDPEQIGPYDLYKVGGSAYWMVFRKQLSTFFEWGKPFILSEWDTFFSKVIIWLLIVVAVIACFVST